MWSIPTRSVSPAVSGIIGNHGARRRTGPGLPGTHGAQKTIILAWLRPTACARALSATTVKAAHAATAHAELPLRGSSRTKLATVNPIAGAVFTPKRSDSWRCLTAQISPSVAKLTTRRSASPARRKGRQRGLVRAALPPPPRQHRRAFAECRPCPTSSGYFVADTGTARWC